MSVSIFGTLLNASFRDSATALQSIAAVTSPRRLYLRRDVLNRAEVVRWAAEQGCGFHQMEGLGQDGSYNALLIIANGLKRRDEAMVDIGASWDWPKY